MFAPISDNQRMSVGPDLIDLLRIVRGRVRLVIATTAIVAGACAAYAILAMPVYRAVTVLAPAESERGMGSLGAALGQLGSLASLAGVGGLDQRNSATEEALAVLRSREFLARFIEERQLLPLLFPSRWDPATRRWRSSWFRPEPTLARGVAYLNDEILSATKDKKTGLVTLTIDWRDRDAAADWANDLVSRVNAEMRGRAMKRAVAYTQFLEQELKSTELVATREAINRLIEEQIKQRMVASVTQEFAFRTIGRAMAPDPDDRLRPRRGLLVVVGLILGLIAGALLAIADAAFGGAFARSGSGGNPEPRPTAS